MWGGKNKMLWAEVKKKLLENDPALKEKLERIEPEYQIIRQIIKARIEQNITQAELANRIGTRQSNISRLERGDYNPSLQFLNKVAKGLGKELTISFK